MTKLSTVERIYRCSIIDPLTGCWNWQGYLLRGYGTISIANKNVRVHRASYEALVGPIPSGLTIDHLCRNRACVNPNHMEPVTIKVNVLRGDTITATNTSKIVCLRGHPLSGNNLRTYKGLRVCRACKMLTARKRRYAERMNSTEYCACGCGGRLAKDTHWLHGHNLRNTIATELNKVE